MLTCTDCRLGTLTIPCPPKDKSGEVCAACQGTGRRLHRHHVVAGEGPAPADIMLIGEAPGHYEDITGKPFRPNAAAGRVLHNALQTTHLEGAVFISNIVKCRPPDNRLSAYPDAIEACRKWLRTEIEAVRPKIVVTLGQTAGNLWFPGQSATAMSAMTRATPDYLVVGSLHPAYVSRDPAAWPSLIRSIERAKALVKEVHRARTPD